MFFTRAAMVRALILVVTASAVTAVATQSVAAAAGPSVDLPQTRSVPVQQQTMEPRPEDQASKNALRGNQPELAPKDGAGSYQATSLAPSSSWDVAPQTGDFTTSYPLRVPPAPGGFVPDLALDYRSSSVDGRTTVTNSQPSWIGDGWDLGPGFIERAYGGCVDDTDGSASPKTGDLCWRTDNATAAYGGGGGQLIRDDGSGVWHPKDDDGSRVERIGSAGKDDESWRITKPDGTQYFFGSEADSQSRWTAPVFGDDLNEPCHDVTYEKSQCGMAWRWNLDKVVDRNGNVIRYYYEPETNSYGLNMKDTPVSYTRGGILVRAEYGMNAGVNAPPSGRIVFTPADRCIPGSDCSQANKGNWPDTPLDGLCTGPTCTKHGPSFFSTKRLASITTQVRDGSDWSDVDRWDLDQQYPDPGSGEKAALWLKGIKHTGLANHGNIELPSMTFEGTQFPNRVLKLDGVSSLNRYRLTGIVSETGAVTSVTYAPPECKDGGPMPDKPETNTMRCFPVRWTREGEKERTDYFHKYVVSQVVQSDRISANTQQVTGYEYLEGAAWHWDMSEFAKDDKKTWNEFRGYGRVRIRVGTSTDPAGPVTMSEQRFHRGMNGDRQPTGTRPVTLTDSEGGSHVDEDWLSGSQFEDKTYEREAPSSAPDPPVVSKTIVDMSWRGPTATRGAFKAYVVHPGVQRQYTALASGGWRTTRTETAYDDLGLPVSVSDLGDVSTAADDRCVTTTYDRKDSAWLMNLPATTETVAVACGVPPVFPTDAISASRKSYDDHGNATLTATAKDRPANAPTYVTTATAAYDVHGRQRRATDAGGFTTTTSYVPDAGGPVTSMTITSPPTPNLRNGMVTTTNAETAFGQPVLVTDGNGGKTRLEYDALGRRTKVWLPNRSGQDDPSLKFTYQIRNDAPTVVGTFRLGPHGRYVGANTLFDGLLRPRQTQTPAPGGGRLLTDTRYDSHGRMFKETQAYFTNTNIDDKLLVASDVDIPGLTRTQYDGAGRAVASVYQGGATEKWRTTVAYGGDRVDVTPPAGGIATTRISDARGQLTELRQYQPGSPTETFDSTRYKHNPAGNLVEVTSAGQVTWRYGYDLRGRRISSDDPDSGHSSRTYNDLDQVVSTTDGRGISVFTDYDALGRVIATHRDRPDGPKLTEFTFDTAANGKGLPATATSFTDGNAYSSSVVSYSTMGQPLETWVTIPPSEGLLSTTYKSYASYNVDTSLAGVTYPAAGGLPAENVSYVVDDFARPLSSSGGIGGTVDLVTATDYTKYGEPQRLQLGKLPNRVWLSTYYDDSTRRVNRSIVDAELPAPMQADAHYSYDPAGNITSLADTVLGQTADAQCFRYDYLRRLTEAWTPNGTCTPDPATNALAGPAPYWQSFQYDLNGNRKSEITHASTGDTVRGYTYPDPAGPQPHTLRSVTTGTTVTDAFTYDPAGNTIERTKSGVSQTLTWDAVGRLATSTQAGQTTSFGYGWDGTRLLRKDPSGTTLYLSGQEVKLPASGGSPVATRYYMFGGKAIAVRQGAKLSWLVGDHQGTGQLTVDAGSMTVTRRRQLPFGSPRGASPSLWPDDHGFVGGIQDVSTGLTHLGAREYDQSTGRFISVDPVQDLSDPQQWNGYAYANNSPVTSTDPSGLWFNNNAPDGECNHGCPYKPGQGPASTQGNNPVTSQNVKPKGGTYRNQDNYKQYNPGGGAYKSPPPPKAAPPPPPPPATCSGSTGYGVQPCAKDTCGPGKAQVTSYAASYNGGTACVAASPITPEEGHMLMDLCGSSEVPYVSQACDAGNALAYAFEGDWENAGISVLGLIPFIGDIATGERLIAKSARRMCSFSGDTKVLMADGSTKPISEIKVGDEVIAADPRTGKRGPRKVTEVLVHNDTVTDLSTTDGSTVTTTEDHPFYDATDQAWERADQLTPGDELVTTAGASMHVAGLRPATSRSALAYNLTVDDLHTYHVLVGQSPVLVHNSCEVDVFQDGNTAIVSAKRDPTESVRVENHGAEVRVDFGKTDQETNSHLMMVGLTRTGISSGQSVVVSSGGQIGVQEMKRAGMDALQQMNAKVDAIYVDEKMGIVEFVLK